MLELFIGLSIDFILVKSWWFDKAKLIKHRRSTLMLAAWSLLKRKKTFNEQKMLPRCVCVCVFARVCVCACAARSKVRARPNDQIHTQ